MATNRVNSSGRSYEPGKSLSVDFRRTIIDCIENLGGDRVTGVFYGFRYIARRFAVAPSTVTKVWKRYCEEYTEMPSPVLGGYNVKLRHDDLELIEVLKAAKGTICLRDIYDILQGFGNVGANISISAISRAIKTRLPSGKKYTLKKVTQIARERFTGRNIIYTQLFINYLNAQDPTKVKFFDESGVKLPDVGTRRYGHAPIGERCVEITRKTQSANYTLNALCSLQGIEYADVVEGATDTVTFLDFFSQALNTTNTLTGEPVLQVGDILVLDNCATHHYDGGEILEESLWEMGIELLYTPTYSPDLNPIEEAFGKIKSKLNNDLIELVHNNLKLAVILATACVSTEDMRGYYRHTSYFNV